MHPGFTRFPCNVDASWIFLSSVFLNGPLGIAIRICGYAFLDS
jgi:hypothetical protein